MGDQTPRCPGWGKTTPEIGVIGLGPFGVKVLISTRCLYVVVVSVVVGHRSSGTRPDRGMTVPFRPPYDTGEHEVRVTCPVKLRDGRRWVREETLMLRPVCTYTFRLRVPGERHVCKTPPIRRIQCKIHFVDLPFCEVTVK